MKNVLLQFFVGVIVSFVAAALSGFFFHSFFNAVVFFVLMIAIVTIVSIFTWHRYPVDIPYKTKVRKIQLIFQENGNCICTNESCDVLIRNNVPLIEKKYLWTGNGTEEAPFLEKGDEVQLFVPYPTQIIGEASVYCLYINGKKLLDQR